MGVMNRNSLIVVSVIILAIVGYLIYANRPATQPTTQLPPTTAPSPTPSGKELTITLNPVAESTESGTAILKEEGGKTMVTLSLNNAPAGVKQPAHIHMGGCPRVGEVKYPLTFPMGGQSETTLEITLDQLKSELPLAINVHKSVPEAKVYVACGDITF